MWAVIVGGPGSCKTAIATRLAKDQGFVVEREEEPIELLKEFDQDHRAWTFELQLEFLIRRYKLQRQIQKRASDEDILQIRSFWDTMLVYTPALAYRNYLTDKEIRNLRLIYTTLVETLEAPHCAIFLHGSAMMTSNRLALSGKGHHEEDKAALTRSYAEYVKMIRIPVIDVEIIDEFDDLIEEIKGGLDAVRSSGATSLSIWNRSFLK